MRPKKNPGKDLNSKRVLYFVLGLLIILALIYIALEWKVEDDNHGFDIGYLLMGLVFEKTPPLIPPSLRLRSG